MRAVKSPRQNTRSNTHQCLKGAHEGKFFYEYTQDIRVKEVIAERFARCPTIRPTVDTAQRLASNRSRDDTGQDSANLVPGCLSPRADWRACRSSRKRRLEIAKWNVDRK